MSVTTCSRTIDFREFVMALQFLSNPSLDDVIDISFRCIDLNNDGTITKGFIRVTAKIRSNNILFSGEMREVMLTNAKLRKYIDVFR